MSAVGMNEEERYAEIAEAARLEEVAAREGEVYGPRLLERSAGSWRKLMRTDPHFRSYGTLRYLLTAARDRFETQPTTAHEITAAVLDFVDDAEAPSHIHAIGLRGLAWKEHANACDAIGDMRAALSAARRAIEIYGESSALVFDATRAKLVVCKVLREIGETERAMALAHECAEIFADFGELPFVNMARMFEAGVLFASKRFTEAFTIFTDIMAEAELDGDRLTVARCLQCAAECARELGDLHSARDFYNRALTHFEALNVTGDANCVRWAYALSLAADGSIAFAVSELFKVRAVFLSLGMNSRAASAALDVVRIKFDAGEDVRELCAELIPVFADAGLTQNALEALAYVREQARSGTLTTRRITRVRTYFDELGSKPTLLFVHPREEED